MQVYFSHEHKDSTWHTEINKIHRAARTKFLCLNSLDNLAYTWQIPSIQAPDKPELWVPVQFALSCFTEQIHPELAYVLNYMGECREGAKGVEKEALKYNLHPSFLFTLLQFSHRDELAQQLTQFICRPYSPFVDGNMAGSFYQYGINTFQTHATYVDLERATHRLESCTSLYRSPLRSRLHLLAQLPAPLKISSALMVRLKHVRFLRQEMLMRRTVVLPKDMIQFWYDSKVDLRQERINKTFLHGDYTTARNIMKITVKPVNNLSEYIFRTKPHPNISTPTQQQEYISMIGNKALTTLSL